MSDWESKSGEGWSGKPVEGAATPSAEKDLAVERRLIEKLVDSMQSEQRKSRRWGIFFKSITLIYLFSLLILWRWPGDNALSAKTGPHTAEVDVKGVIAADAPASAKRIIKGLQRAFDDPNTRGVILKINSPGGSPVQAGMVYDEIRRLRGLHPDIHLYAVITDIGASGAYYMASAADDIYADKASLVGSIGVISSGFGFTQLMDKLGVSRRLYTAGAHKAFLDPFSPQKPEEVKLWQQVLDTTHQQFIDAVKKGRGDRLKTDNDQLFSGLVWTGQQGLKLGLIDGLGSPEFVARDVIKAKDIVNYSSEPSAFDRLARRFGVSFGTAFADHLLQTRFDLQ